MRLERSSRVACLLLLVGACREVAELEPSSAPVALGGDAQRGAELFARHCTACHGSSGEADGIAAPLLYPAPRAFSSGRFLIASTSNGVPTDSDLVATLARGMPGSSMPAWHWLGEPALRDLAAHVRELARRGLALRLAREALERGEALDATEIESRARAAVTPGEPVRLPRRIDVNASTIARGRALFRANCETCHGAGGTGRGDEVLFNEDGGLNWARDFTAGILKGGSSFEALAARIQVGLPGTSMPVFSLPPSDVAALATFTASLIPADSERRLVHRHETLQVPRTQSALPDDARSAAWGDARELEVVLAPVVWHAAAVLGAKVAAVHDGQRIAIRLRWRDATRDDVTTNESELRDAAALAFSNEDAPPLFGMGAHDQPVNLWHWKAERMIDAKGMLDLVRKLPHTWIDPVFGESRLDVGPVYLPAPSSSVAAGRPLELSAETFAAIRELESEGKALACAARYDDGEWAVVFTRSLEPRVEREVMLRPGVPALVALAIWDGSGGDRGGCKSTSIWQKIALE